MGEVVQTPFARGMFVRLFEPRAMEEGKKPRYGLVLAFDKAAQEQPAFKKLVAIQKAARAQGVKELWKGSEPEGLISGFKKGSHFIKKGYSGFNEDDVCIQPWSYEKPGVVGPNREELLPADVWSGQIFRASIDAYPFLNKGNAGVSFGLKNVQVAKLDCPRMDGKKNAKDEFGDVDPSISGVSSDGFAGAGSDDMDDEIPF